MVVGRYYFLDACRLRALKCGRVAGLDPGLKRVGLAVAEKVGGVWRIVYSGVVDSVNLGLLLPDIVKGVCACGIDSPSNPSPQEALGPWRGRR